MAHHTDPKLCDCGGNGWTPGPWFHAGTFGGSEYIEAQGGRVNVARAFGREGEAQANARLIAAAPELLEALRELEAWSVAGISEANNRLELLKAITEARAAIAKAEGRS